MLASWLTAMMLMLWLRREAAAGRSVLDGPRRWFGGIGRGHVLAVLVTTGAVVALVWLLQADGAMLVAFGWPEVATIGAAIDLPALLDLTLIAVVAAGQARFGTLRRALPMRRPRARRRRTHRATPPRAANDDDGRRFRAA